MISSESLTQGEYEARRRARWGASSYSRAWQQQQQSNLGGGGYGGGRRDFLGYYAMLGLDAELASTVTEGDVKRAFREAALRWHPDRQKVSIKFFPGDIINPKMLDQDTGPSPKDLSAQYEGTGLF